MNFTYTGPPSTGETYTHRQRIISANIFYGEDEQPTPGMDTAAKPKDVVLKLELADMDKPSFTTKLTYSCNWKRDPITNEPIDKGQVFKILDVFGACRLQAQVENNRFSEECVSALVGCIVCSLSYKSSENNAEGKPRYKTWEKLTYLQDETDDAFKKAALWITQAFYKATTSKYPPYKWYKNADASTEALPTPATLAGW